MNLSGGNSEQSSASYSSKGLDYYLSHKPQIILAGPPGTSKTWSATEYVETQMGGKRFEMQKMRMLKTIGVSFNSTQVMDMKTSFQELKPRLLMEI